MEGDELYATGYARVGRTKRVIRSIIAGFVGVGVGLAANQLVINPNFRKPDPMALAAGTGRDKVEGPTFLSAVSECSWSFGPRRSRSALVDRRGGTSYELEGYPRSRVGHRSRVWLFALGACGWTGHHSKWAHPLGASASDRNDRTCWPLCNCDCNSLLGPGSRFWLVELGGGRIARTLSGYHSKVPTAVRSGCGENLPA